MLEKVPDTHSSLEIDTAGKTSVVRLYILPANTQDLTAKAW